MKKFIILLIVAPIFVVCYAGDDDKSRSVIIFHPDATLIGDQTNVEDVTGARIFADIFSNIISSSNSGWATYRWRKLGEKTSDNDRYKISYLEKAGANLYVGAGIWLNADNPNIPKDANGNLTGRIERQRQIVDRALAKLNGAMGDGRVAQNFIDGGCRGFYENDSTYSAENDEVYLFVGEINNPTIIKCHPRAEIKGANIYPLLDDFNKQFVMEILNELALSDFVWKAYRFPKLGDPDTFNDPTKLSYIRKTEDGKYFVGSGIYLDKGNANAQPNDRLEIIRKKVNKAAGLLIKDSEVALAEFNKKDANGRLVSDYVTGEMGDAYVFVWEIK